MFKMSICKLENEWSGYNNCKLKTKKMILDDSLDITKIEKEGLNDAIVLYNKVYANIDVYKNVVHPSILYLIENGTNNHFIVTKKQGAFRVFDPKTIDDVEKIYVIFKDLIEKLHSNNYIHYNITPASFLTDGETFTLNDHSKLIHVNNFLKQGPVAGSKIISPLHLILEMLYSTIEDKVIPVGDFKSKFIKFYNIVSDKEYINVLKICQRYYSINNGVLDYIDYVLNKFCIIKDGLIYKNPIKTKHFYHHIDWFSFGIVLHNYLHNVYVESVVMKRFPDESLVKFITECLTYEYNISSK